MAAIPAKVSARLVAGLKKFQPILANAKARDVNESDTVVMITDMLQEIFGYDKYSEITSEHMIRGTFCDLAIKLDGGVQLLIEVKAIGLELKDAFVKQAVDYAANQGTEWVVLTNGLKWRVYRVKFSKPIEQELVLEFNMGELNPKNDDHLGMVWLLAKEGWLKARLGEYVAQKEALSRFFLGAVLVSPPVLDVVRRELRRLSPDAKIETDEIKNVLEHEVLKREVIEGEKADEAKKQLSRAANRALRVKGAKGDATGETPIPADAEPAPITKPEVAPA